jgi:hypothetical protein
MNRNVQSVIVCSLRRIVETLLTKHSQTILMIGQIVEFS